MKNITKWILMIGIIILILIAVRFIIGGPEDTWICSENGWIKHGNPNLPMPTRDCPLESIKANNDSIKVANWNLQIFGDSKEANSTLMDFYASIIDDYDIIFIQEIRDEDGSAFIKLCALLQNYDCKVSSRAGRSSSKEQYGIIYKRGIIIKDFKDYNPDTQDRWERPPVSVLFVIGGKELRVYDIHTKPEDTPKELANLEQIVSTQGNVIVLGDMNADCDYFNHANNKVFENWTWAIGDKADTTVSSTDCAYDRIILNQNYTSAGIFKDGINKDISDHYLVWIKI